MNYSRPSDGAIRRLPLSALVIALLALVPVLLRAQAPSWWQQRGVLNGEAPDDYAAINQGQLKNLVQAAAFELDAKLVIGAGDVLRRLLAGWATPTANTDDFAAVNLGQLKAAAEPVYDRLRVGGFLAAVPWGQPGDPIDDFAMANIGQAKNLFAFDITNTDTNSVGIPDWWRNTYGLVFQNATGALATAPGGISFLLKYQLGLNPLIADTDGDGVPDGQDARPNDPASGLLSIAISTPVNNSNIP